MLMKQSFLCGALAVFNLSLAAGTGLAQSTAPVIFFNPSNRVAAFGSTVTFSVNATGAPPLVYRWLKDGAMLPSPISRFLILSNVVAVDAGLYAAVVANAFGSVTSAPALLTLTSAPPRIILQPTNTLLCAGAILRVSASGSPPLHYQWRFKGTDLPGQNATMLSIPGDSANAGAYSVVVTNNSGTVTSAVALVELGPRIIQQPAGQTVLAGSPVTLAVIAAACEPRFQWRLEGTNLPGRTNSFFTIAGATPSDAGDYSVIVSDSTRSVTSVVARLEVQGQAPAITYQPVDLIDVVWVTNISFWVGFTGVPTPAIQWRFNGLSLPGATNELLVLPATPNRQGGYSVVLSNSFGSVTSRVATFSFRADALVPKIASNGHPLSRALCPQTNALFFYIDTENPPTVPLFFQWRKDGADLPGATGRFLRLDGAPSDVGDYTVVITNAYGAVTSEVARVSFAPAIIRQPTGADIPDGGGFCFFAIAESCVPVEFQWQQNGLNVPGGTNVDLCIIPTTPVTAGDYRVIARNSFGSVTSQVARLVVVQIPPTVLSNEPPDLTVDAGQDAYFSVPYYTAAPPPTFQWRFNGVAIPGETNQFLQFRTASTNQNGGYSLVLSNVAGAATSRVAQLTVIVAPPEISPDHPFDQVLDVGEQAAFFVNYVALPPPTFQWRFNGADIPGETNSYLYFLVASTNHAGGYSVVLSNAFGVATSRVARLTVDVYPPEITWQPADLTANAGTFVNFSLGVRSSPPPGFQWRFNGLNIPGATNQFLNFTAGFTNQEGGYSVIVSNEFGSVTSRVAMLDIILLEPRFATQPRSQIVLVGANVSFLGGLSNNVPTYFQWQFNDDDLPGATNLSLYLSNVDTNDAGAYQLIAWNDAGRATSAVATLTVRLPDALDHWHWRRPAPQGHPLYSVTHDGVRFIAVGENAFVTSTNGMDWVNSHHFGDVLSRFELVAGNGVLVSLYGASLQASTNGVDWSDVGPEGLFSARSISYGAGRFVALGGTSGGAGTAISTNGWDWELLPAFTSHYAVKVAYVGGRFLTTCGNYTGFAKTQFFTSIDGEIWVQCPGDTIGYFTDFAYGGGLYVSVASDIAVVATSPDGTNWTAHVISSAPRFTGSAVAFGAGRFVAVSVVYGAPSVATSADGLNWSLIPGTPTNGLRDITFAAGRFVAVGSYGAIATSTDGLNWSQFSGGSDRNFRDLTRGGSLYVAVGNEGMLLTSPDGTAWTGRVSGTSNNLRGATFFKNRFVVVGEEDESGATILTSTDATAWIRSTAPGNLFGLAHNGERLVAVGDDGVVVTSLDGLTWTNVFNATRPNPAGNRDLNAVTWGGGRFVAVGRDGRVIVSSNGLDWASASFSSPNLHGVAYGNGLYVAVARAGGVAYSTNATNWESFRLDNADEFSDVGFGGGEFIAIGENGMMFTSTNGIHWIPRITSCQYDLRAVLYAEGSFRIAGDNETILQSRQTAPALRIAWLPTPGQGRTRIEMLCEPGRKYRLQVSEDLAHWTDLYNFTASSEMTYFARLVGGTPRGQFYRMISP